MPDPADLIGSLAVYRLARRELLAAAGRPTSNRDPIAEWAEALVEAVIDAPRVSNRVNSGHDLVDVTGRRIEVKTLANTPGLPWVNWHVITTHPGRDLYAIVVIEDLAPLGLFVFDLSRLADLGALLGKRHLGQKARIEFLERNARSIMDDPARFAEAGVALSSALVDAGAAIQRRSAAPQWVFRRDRRWLTQRRSNGLRRSSTRSTR